VPILFACDQPPTWAEMLHREAAGAQQAIRQVVAVPIDETPHGTVLEACVELRGAAKTIRRAYDRIAADGKRARPKGGRP
jgi:hypothetical protein